MRTKVSPFARYLSQSVNSEMITLRHGLRFSTTTPAEEPNPARPETNKIAAGGSGAVTVAIPPSRGLAICSVSSPSARHTSMAAVGAASPSK